MIKGTGLVHLFPGKNNCFSLYIDTKGKKDDCNYVWRKLFQPGRDLVDKFSLCWIDK